jgi:hypothetical protein
MRRKLAPKIIEYLKAPGPKRLDVWDTVLQGFGIRVSPSGRKAWFADLLLNVTDFSTSSENDRSRGA